MAGLIGVKRFGPERQSAERAHRFALPVAPSKDYVSVSNAESQ
jgi:hypothetical protein